MHSPFIQADRRPQMAAEVLHLTQACPFDHCNPEYCPLHDVRKLSGAARKEWVELLSISDLEYLLTHHEICLQARSDRDLARISKLNMDELAERIRFNLGERGMHILSNEELGIILGHRMGKTEIERRMHVDNFCIQYGFVSLHEDGFTTLTLAGC